MFAWLNDLDRVLRGEATRIDDLREGTIPVPLVGLTFVIIVLGLFYGACMGSFAMLRGAEAYRFELAGVTFAVSKQLVASAVKVPALFFLTLLVTFPSLYVLNALVGSRLHTLAVLKLLIATLGVDLAVLASLGPIVAFFSVSTTSYPFMVLLNVLVFAVAGVLGLVFLLQTLHRLTVAQATSVNPPPVDTAGESASDADVPADVQPIDKTGALERLEGQVLAGHVKVIFRVWVVIFGLVGAQMGWVLRPFVGDPRLPFEWLRQRESNFFQAVFESFRQLFLER